MDTENEVQDVEEAGLGSRMISRRTLIKGGAIVGGTVWVAPAIESFASRAFAGSQPKTCVACFEGGTTLVGAGEDDFNATTAVSFCQGQVVGSITHGTYVLFVSASSGFSSSDTTGCTWSGPPSTLLGPSTDACPTTPAGVSCTTGTY